VPRQFGKIDGSTTWACDRCPHKHEPGSRCPPAGVWLVRGGPVGRLGVVWLKRLMPDGQWPVNQRLPRDDSFSLLVRSHCGHQGGARQWAFYEERYADLYGHLFRSNPCWYTRCPDFMIQNDKRMSRG